MINKDPAHPLQGELEKKIPQESIPRILQSNFCSVTNSFCSFTVNTGKVYAKKCILTRPSFVSVYQNRPNDLLIYTDYAAFAKRPTHQDVM